MAIKYEAFNRLGEKVRGVLQTDSTEQAYEMLDEEDLIPYRLRPVRHRPSLVRLMPGLFKPKQQDIIDFTRQLAALLNSGIPLQQSLIVMRDQIRSPGLKEALQQITASIQEGERISAAFSPHTTVFPEFYLRLLTVGEGTGGLQITLEQLTTNLQRRKDVADKVKRALVYPAFNLVAALGAGILLVTYTLPALTNVLKEFGGDLPTSTRLLLSISDFFQSYGTYIIAPFFATVILVPVAMRTRAGGALVSRFLLRIPVAGSVIMASNMFFLTNTLSTLMRAAVPTIEALKLTEQAIGNSTVRENLAKVTVRASEGQRLGEAFEQQKGFPSIMSKAIVTGEMTGGLVDSLTGLAQYYEDVTQRAVGGATELIQPLVILVIVGIVGFVAVAGLSGIYSSLGTIR